MRIRPERAEDLPQIRVLNDLAFGGTAEGAIVDAIRAACPQALSFVAADGERVVGHVFFSPVSVEGVSGVEAMGLGPMAVLPERQRQGIGSALVAAGIEELRRRGCRLVVVLGHAEYYPRFGFVPASRHGLASQWPGVPDEAFMVRFLDNGASRVVRGEVRYREEFDAAV